MSSRSETIRRRFIAKGNVPLYHEGRQTFPSVPPSPMKDQLTNQAMKISLPLTLTLTLANLNRQHARRRQIPRGHRISRGAKHRQRSPEGMFRFGTGVASSF